MTNLCSASLANLASGMTLLSSIYESPYLPFVLPLDLLDCLLNRKSTPNKRSVNNQLISSLGLKLHLCIRAHNKHVP